MYYSNGSPNNILFITAHLCNGLLLVVLVGALRIVRLNSVKYQNCSQVTREARGKRQCYDEHILDY